MKTSARQIKAAKPQGLRTYASLSWLRRLGPGKLKLSEIRRAVHADYLEEIRETAGGVR